MDPALKKRMIGAAILIVLAIIFVPMLFTGRPREQTETVDLNLPKTPDRDFTTRTIPLDTAPKPKPAPESGDAVATVDTAKEREKTPVPAASPAVAPAAPAPAKPLAAAPSPKPPEPAATAPEGTSEGSSDHGRWAVSYGTYAKHENADKLVADLKKAGIAAYGEPVPVKDAMGVRVRSGPYLDRSQAEKARLSARAARADVTGKLIELDDTTNHEPSSKPATAAVASATPASTPVAAAPAAAAPAAPAHAATAVAGWAVQVGAYQTERDANGRRDALRGAGFSAYVESVKTAKGTLYRVRVGPTTERAGADKLRGELKERMKLDGTVVQEP